MNILFICTSNRDRSVALENYYKVRSPKHNYKSAGINRYKTALYGTNYINEEDLEWADIVICAEEIHKKITLEKFPKFIQLSGYFYVLGVGDYEKKNMVEYLKKAEGLVAEILKKYE